MQKKHNSRSGWIIPNEAFRKINVDINKDIKVIKYSGHPQAKEALKIGEVDAITSFWGDSDHKWADPSFKVALSTAELKGTRWYLLGKWIKHPICRLSQDLLIKSAVNTKNQYFHDLNINQRCNEE